MNLNPNPMLGHNWRYLHVTVIWLCLVVAVPALGQVRPHISETMATATADSCSDLPGQIRLVAYRASAFSYEISGMLLWLDGPEGLRRLEIRRGNAPHALAALLNQQGDGWTLVIGGTGAGTLNSWGAGWHTPPPGLQRATEVVGRALRRGAPTGGKSRKRWRSQPAATLAGSHQVGSLSDRLPPSAGFSEFRRRLGRRGLGRGGEDEMLSLDWVTGSAESGPWLRIRSSRHPGQLELATLEQVAVVYAMPEAFVPLWPLHELIEITRNP